MENAGLIKILLWGLGVCCTGFFFLAGWLIKLTIEINNRVTYKWIEEQFQLQLDKKINNINDKLEEIRTHIVGDLQNKGIIIKIHEHHDRIAKLETDD